MPHDFEKFPELTNSAMAIYYFESPHRQITSDFRATVVKVSDGDTVRLEWDERDFDFPLRIALINAPELNEGGEESKTWLKNRIEGKEVQIKIDPENRVGKFGRLIGEIIFEGLNIGNESVMLGHATKFGTPTGQIQRLEEILA